MADTLQDLERFVRDFALFQGRFMNEPDVVAARRAPAGTATAPRAAGTPPRRTA